MIKIKALSPVRIIILLIILFILYFVIKLILGGIIDIVNYPQNHGIFYMGLLIILIVGIIKNIGQK